MLTAIQTAQEGRLVLLGVKPEWAETGYGWIVAGASLGSGVREVRSFVEKPDASAAASLHRSGALWNTFVFAGAVSDLWKLMTRHLPAPTQTFDEHFAAEIEPTEGSCLARVYRRIERADFSRQVLQRGDRLAVVEVRSSGWSDWGTPERVFASLAGTPDLRHLEARLSRQSGVRGDLS
jgi:mannose-1-phosphate guanylyltransferase